MFLRRFLVVCAHWLRVFLYFLFPPRLYIKFGRRKAKEDKKVFYRHQPKPAWVRTEIIRLKAFMREAGCRTIAHTFNRIYAESKQMTVSKTFVNEVVRKHKYEIQIVRRKIRNRIPRDVARNLVWGMDLTGKMDDKGGLHNILGIIEHKSRMTLGLTALKDKASITILRFLLDAIERYGKPRIVRTDNEHVFTSWLFTFCLRLMSIRHQRIDLCCPWQNGRVERFFGTLKEKLNQWQVNNREQLDGALGQFKFWYNHVRPHQNLDGRTPAEVWNGLIYLQKGLSENSGLRRGMDC
ncbi:MAG: DDE-type integrase/transposase/recombinase [Deltaproteobacteria bacterium]|nr:DDE-type integrase/transposase/recombinase [Deltaproteobacteria bacterium]